MASIVVREYEVAHAELLSRSGLPRVLARVLAARRVCTPAQIEYSLARLLQPEQMQGIATMASLLDEAIAQAMRILVVADYDADGATACAVVVRSLRSMGAAVDYLVPNRFDYGYGLTPEIVALASLREADIIITVDNGISSLDGVYEANRRGITVLITDHHLPGEKLPEAAAIINPNQPGCPFPSKHLAGVGVAFYLMLALRSGLRARGVFTGRTEPNLGEQLDLVALGTVADLVSLDDNNRILVEQGLRRIRAGRGCPGIKALLEVAGKSPEKLTAQDLGFAIGPRLNAAGRLQDMSLGIACLLAEDIETAMPLARQLDALNRERRDIEAEMHAAALLALEQFEPGAKWSLSLYQPDWHQGVIGILASRLKEHFHRPVIAFASADDSSLKGSGRSIPGLHLRDALDLLAKRHPGLLLRFGGHAMAAGLTIAKANYPAFTDAFEAIVRELLTPAMLNCVIETDGAIPAQEITPELAGALERHVWGQGFPQPEFYDTFTVVDQRVVGERHLKLKLELAGLRFDAILFGSVNPLPLLIRAVYRLQTNEYNGTRGVQLVLRYWEAADAL